MKKKFASFLIFCFLFFNISYSIELDKSLKYPDLSMIYLGEDKYEKTNRKIFDFNMALNKLFAKQVHIVWASIFPKFLIDSINCAYYNIEFPKRAISSILQKDFYALKNETKRFIINTTLGLAGFIDVADKIFKIEFCDEDIEQALANCKMNCGAYLVLPFISSATKRDLIGRIFDFLLTPTTYISTPITAAIKLGLLINRTSQTQALIKMVESNFIDGYEIARTIYGIEKYIKKKNLDRKSVIKTYDQDYDETDLVDNKQERLSVVGTIKNSTFKEVLALNELKADIILKDYNPQSPILDSMRTVLLEYNRKNQNKFWSELSIWNRDFSKKIKKDYIEISPNREKYCFKYLLQKNKTSPLAIIFPSIGEGIDSSHSSILGSMFYSEGYSIIILGSHFQYEFLKSIEKNYKIGNIQQDIKFLNIAINNIVNYLSKKYNVIFLNKTALGTSLGAYGVMFLADNQYKNNLNFIDKFIAISPPYELLFAIKQINNVLACWKNYPDDLGNKIALVVSKVQKAYKTKDKSNIKTLPFSNYEAKLISGFIFHKKLVNLIYEIEEEKNQNFDKKEFYKKMTRYDFDNYIKDYLLVNNTLEELREMTSMNSIKDYLIHSNNYKIYEGIDDYLLNKEDLKKLKQMCENKLTIFSSGAHLGYLYRKEFQDMLKDEIKLK